MQDFHWASLYPKDLNISSVLESLTAAPQYLTATLNFAYTWTWLCYFGLTSNNNPPNQKYAIMLIIIIS